MARNSRVHYPEPSTPEQEPVLPAPALVPPPGWVAAGPLGQLVPAPLPTPPAPAPITTADLKGTG
jgi:hypothetical protein